MAEQIKLGHFAKSLRIKFHPSAAGDNGHPVDMTQNVDLIV